MGKQHTPGPWRIHATASSIEVRPEKGAPICEIITHDAAGPIADPDQDRANARLITAAPDMLEALRQLLDDKYLSDPINNDRMRPIRAAIAKAEGKA